MTEAEQYFKGQHELANKLHSQKNRGFMNMFYFGFNNYERTGIEIGKARKTKPKQNERRINKRRKSTS